MKKIILAAFSATIFFIACTPKAAPVATAPGAYPTADAVSKNQTNITSGQTIFITKCAKCHAPKTNYIANHTYEESIPVMTSMIKKAKLTDEEIQQVSAYVNSIAKK